jgi:hypothetical protein
MVVNIKWVLLYLGDEIGWSAAAISAATSRTDPENLRCGALMRNEKNLGRKI